MIITKLCPICKNNFETDRNAKMYCSDECKKKSLQKPERTFVCQCCGKDFKSVRKRKYCDPSCRSYFEGKLPLIEKKNKPKHSLSDILTKAREEGLTYGQYVAKYKL